MYVCYQNILFRISMYRKIQVKSMGPIDFADYLHALQPSFSESKKDSPTKYSTQSLIPQHEKIVLQSHFFNVFVCKQTCHINTRTRSVDQHPTDTQWKRCIIDCQVSVGWVQPCVTCPRRVKKAPIVDGLPWIDSPTLSPSDILSVENIQHMYTLHL